jgi:hypothetical protein
MATLIWVLRLFGSYRHTGVMQWWIPAHKGYVGNKKADSLAKLGSANSDSSVARLPIPKVIWKGAQRERSHRKMRVRWRELPTSHFKRVWRDKFTKSISKFGKESQRSAIQFLTGHCELNYHINRQQIQTQRNPKNLSTLPYGGGDNEPLHWPVSQMVISTRGPF